MRRRPLLLKGEKEKNTWEKGEERTAEQATPETGRGVRKKTLRVVSQLAAEKTMDRNRLDQPYEQTAKQKKRYIGRTH